MSFVRALSTKGQVTIPLEIRQRLGLVEGDLVEFGVEGGAVVVRPVRREGNAFAAYAGVLPGIGDRAAVVEWVRGLRDESEPE